MPPTGCSAPTWRTRGVTTWPNRRVRCTRYPFHGSSPSTSATPCCSWPRTKGASSPAAPSMSARAASLRESEQNGYWEGPDVTTRGEGATAMAGRVEGKVAFITGAARGQGRSHAVELAQEGADIIAVDSCGDIPAVTAVYSGATDEDMAQTVREVEALDRRIVSVKADVRDYDALSSAVEEGVATLGRLDIVVANAGIFTFGTDTHL